MATLESAATHQTAVSPQIGVVSCTKCGERPSIPNNMRCCGECRKPNTACRKCKTRPLVASNMNCCHKCRPPVLCVPVEKVQLIGSSLVIQQLMRVYRCRSFLQIGTEHTEHTLARMMAECQEPATIDYVDPETLCGVPTQQNSSAECPQHTGVYDLIFIQTLRSVDMIDCCLEHALKCLSSGGCIVVQNCSPPAAERCIRAPVRDDHTEAADGEAAECIWNSLGSFQRSHTGFQVVVVDTDSGGVGVIQRTALPDTEMEALQCPSALQETVHRCTQGEGEVHLVSLKSFQRAHATGFLNVPMAGWPSRADEWPIETFYINLDSRPDRRERMEAIISRNQLDKTTRVPACTPKHPQVEQWMRDHPENGDIIPGWVASAHSHAECWSRIAQLEHGSVGLVLEDDVVFHKEWKNTLWEQLSSLASGWELFMLDAWYMDGWDFSVGGTSRKPGVHGISRCAFADAYMLTPAAARWLLEQREKLSFWNHETFLLELQTRGRAYSSTPKLALQIWGDTLSDVQPSGRVGAFQKFYSETYHKVWPRELYDYDTTPTLE